MNNIAAALVGLDRPLSDELAYHADFSNRLSAVLAGRVPSEALVNRTALDAANAVAWPGDDDAAVSITDEDDLKKVLEAAAPHIIAEALQQYAAEQRATMNSEVGR